jgi:hypothetical protein
MPVILRADVAGMDTADFDEWVGIDTQPALDPARQRRQVGEALEAAFEGIREDWLDLACRRAGDPGAELAQTLACAPNISDFGVMLAWTVLVRAWAQASSRVLVVCRDPWLFRHLEALPGVLAGGRPVLWRRACGLWLRGYAARLLVALRVALTVLRLRSRRQHRVGETALLVYGHPRSTADGVDGYFGTLMQRHPALRRVLHVDCGYERARQLDADGRTVSLHAWGSVLEALSLPWARWRPRRVASDWLVRRAAALEGGTGQAAAIAWQIHCQRRWLRRARPALIAWPWENHAWERDLVRACRGESRASLGYQHSVIGRHMYNYSPGSNPDGKQGLPDRIFCTGEATRRQLAQWGVPQDRLVIAGALRFSTPPAALPARGDVVFVALPANLRVARQMIEAVKRLAKGSFVVKEHPMTPCSFEDTQTVRRTTLSWDQHPGVGLVLFASTTVGQEALLAGMPVVRFRPRDCIAIDILPTGVRVPVADDESLETMLDKPIPVETLERGYVFADPDLSTWDTALTVEEV